MIGERDKGGELTGAVASPPARRERDTRGIRPWLRALLAGGLGWALVLFLALRFAFSLFAFIVAQLGLARGGCPPQDQATASLTFRLLRVWQQWDTCWYERVAATGYAPGDATINFYPLYPLLMRLASIPLGGDLTLGGLTVSGLCYIAGVTGLYRLLRHDFDERIARRATLYLSVFPSAFFFFAAFTEPLFFVLTVWTIYLARRGSWGWAIPAAFLVGLTRTQGFLLAAPLAWEFWRQWRSGRCTWRAALVVPLPVASFAGFLIFAKLYTGWTPLETGAKIWQARPQAPWEVVVASWRHIWRRGDLVEGFNLGLLLLFIVILAVGIRRLPFAYTAFAAPQLLLIISHVRYISPLGASSRYMLTLFPVFVLLALVGRHRGFHYPYLLLSLAGLGYLFYTFLTGPFVA